MSAPKYTRLSRACDVAIIPYVQEKGENRFLNLKFKGKIERYYGIKRLVDCAGSPQGASMEIKRITRWISIEYQIKIYFEIGTVEDTDSDKNNVINRLKVVGNLPDSISVDAPGIIDSKTIVNQSDGLAFRYEARTVGDSVLAIFPHSNLTETLLNIRCSRANDFCAKERERGDVVRVSFSSFDPRYDLPGLIGIGAGLLGIAAGVAGSGIFRIFGRRKNGTSDERAEGEVR